MQKHGLIIANHHPWKNKFKPSGWDIISSLFLCQIIPPSPLFIFAVTPHDEQTKKNLTDSSVFQNAAKAQSLHTHEMRFSPYLTLMCNLLFTPWLDNYLHCLLLQTHLCHITIPPVTDILYPFPVFPPSSHRLTFLKKQQTKHCNSETDG